MKLGILYLKLRNITGTGNQSVFTYIPPTSKDRRVRGAITTNVGLNVVKRVEFILTITSF